MPESLPANVSTPESEAAPSSVLNLQMLDAAEAETDYCFSFESSCQSFISNCC